MVECPVCHHTFENEFALQGHIRLKRDSEHMVFKRQQAEKPSQGTITTPIIQPTSNSTRAILENVLREKERQFIQDENDDKFLQKLENLLRKDREADEKTAEEHYHRGWSDRDKLCQEEIKDVRSYERKEAEQYCQEKIIADCAKVRDEVLQQCQHSVNAAFKQGKNEYSFYYWCADCDRKTLIVPGSAYYKDITDLLRWLEVICPKCSRRRGLSPRFHSLSYIDISNRIAYLER